MATFKELSRLNGSRRGLEALGIVLANSPVMNAFDLHKAVERVKTKDTFTPISASGDAANRAFGGGYTPVALTPAADQAISLAFIGGEAVIDASIVADYENDPVKTRQWLDNQVKRNLIQYSKNTEAQIFNGTGSSNQIKGLKTILNGTDDIPGFTGKKGVLNAKEIDKASNATFLDLTLDGTNYLKNIKVFTEYLSKAVSTVTPGPGKLIFANADMIHRLTSIAKTDNVYDIDRTTYGVPVVTYNGTPIIQVNSSTILSTEPDDTPETALNVTTSIYIVSMAEFQFSLGTNSGLEYFELPNMQAVVGAAERWEMRLALKIEDPDSVLRIRNIKV